MHEQKQDVVRDRAAEHVSRLLDRPGLRRLVNVAQQADGTTPEEPDTDTSEPPEVAC
jgi:hypothetical protein